MEQIPAFSVNPMGCVCPHRLPLKHSQELLPLFRRHFKLPVVLHGNRSSLALRVADYIVRVDQVRAMDPEEPMLL